MITLVAAYRRLVVEEAYLVAYRLEVEAFRPEVLALGAAHRVASCLALEELLTWLLLLETRHRLAAKIAIVAKSLTVAIRWFLLYVDQGC